MKNIYKIVFLIVICLVFISGVGIVFAFQVPTVDAGPDLYVTSGTYNANPSAILQGSGYDSNGGTLSFAWMCTGGVLSNYNIPQPLFTAPNNTWQSTVYTCTLTVTDNYGLSASDSTTIYINYNQNNSVPSLGVQTNPATNNYNSQATLNGQTTGSNYAPGTIYGWFQWGTTTSYGYESAHNVVEYIGPFNQNIANLLPNTTYHFRAVAQNNYGTVYGQDMTFNSSGGAVVQVPTGGQVLGASSVSTGLTNNFLTDSFFLPLLIIIAGLWFYFSGEAEFLADRLKARIRK